MTRWVRIAFVVLVAASSASCSAPVQPPQESAPLHPSSLASCPTSPNCVSSQAPATDSAHYVAPLRITGDPAHAMDDLRRIIESMPRTRIVAASPTALHAEFTSRIFRFVGDVDLQLDAPAHIVQIRSASRTGYADWGVNRRRVEAIRQAFENGAPPA